MFAPADGRRMSGGCRNDLAALDLDGHLALHAMDAHGDDGTSRAEGGRKTLPLRMSIGP